LEDLTNALDAADGITASISNVGALVISTDSADVDFAFDGDTSGVLAALGINTFFAGATASTLRVNEVLQDERLFAASGGGIDADTTNAEQLAVFYDRSLESAGGSSLAELYSQMVNIVTQGSDIAQSVADGFRLFEGSLEGEALAISGVNIDEEAIRMILLQRTYQAAARHIQTVSDLLDILVNL
jgi:flagellar hook-associated protein 1 FlgK